MADNRKILNLGERNMYNSKHRNDSKAPRGRYETEYEEEDDSGFIVHAPNNAFKPGPNNTIHQDPNTGEIISYPGAEPSRPTNKPSGGTVVTPTSKPTSVVKPTTPPVFTANGGDRSDYQAMINAAVAQGDFHKAAILEQMRNEKIQRLDREGNNTWNAQETNQYLDFLHPKQPEVNLGGGSITPVTANRPQLENLHMGDRYNLTYDMDKILGILNSATDAKYDALWNDYGETENRFLNQMINQQDLTQEALRNSNAQAIATGASKGMVAAQQLAALLGVQQTSADGALQLANSRNKLASQQRSETAANSTLALDKSNQIKNIIAQLDQGKYGYDTQGYIGDLNYNAALNDALASIKGAQIAADANKYATDKQFESNKYAVDNQPTPNAGNNPEAGTNSNKPNSKPITSPDGSWGFEITTDKDGNTVLTDIGTGNQSNALKPEQVNALRDLASSGMVSKDEALAYLQNPEASGSWSAENIIKNIPVDTYNGGNSVPVYYNGEQLKGAATTHLLHFNNGTIPNGYKLMVYPQQVHGHGYNPPKAIKTYTYNKLYGTWNSNEDVITTPTLINKYIKNTTNVLKFSGPK